MNIKYFIRQLQHNAKRRKIVVLLLSIGGFILNTIIFYPGVLSPDSIDQYGQALHNSYGDWHPPAMAALWHLLLNIYNGPEPMLFFQLGLLWGSFYILCNSFLKHVGPLSFFLILLFAAPFVQNFPGIIWKDMHMALSWLFATAIMLNTYLDGRKLSAFESVITIVFISYGCWVRLSGFPAIFPLLFLWWRLSIRNSSFSKVPMSLIASIVLTFLVIQIEDLFSKKVLKAKENHIEYKLIAHDLTGISIKSGELCFPEYISKYAGFDTAYIFTRYTCVTFDYIWWNSDNKQVLPELNSEQINDLKKYWIKTVRKHPLIYLKNKTKGFLYFLRIKDSGSPITITYPETYENNFGFSYHHNALNTFVIDAIEKQRKTPYMKPWFWYLLNIFLLILASNRALRAYRHLLLSLSLSTLLYLAIHFFIYPIDTEFRYFYWPCVCEGLTLLLCAVLWNRKKVTTMYEDKP